MIPLSRLDSNWETAFSFSCGYPINGCCSSNVPVTTWDSPHVSNKPFGKDDVAEIIFIEDGENYGSDWIGVFRLQDGRYACLSAGCDYTGWD